MGSPVTTSRHMSSATTEKPASESGIDSPSKIEAKSAKSSSTNISTGSSRKDNGAGLFSAAEKDEEAGLSELKAPRLQSGGGPSHPRPPMPAPSQGDELRTDGASNSHNTQFPRGNDLRESIMSHPTPPGTPKVLSRLSPSVLPATNVAIAPAAAVIVAKPAVAALPPPPPEKASPEIFPLGDPKIGMSAGGALVGLGLVLVAFPVIGWGVGAVFIALGAGILLASLLEGVSNKLKSPSDIYDIDKVPLPNLSEHLTAAQTKLVISIVDYVKSNGDETKLKKIKELLTQVYNNRKCNKIELANTIKDLKIFDPEQKLPDVDSIIELAAIMTTHNLWDSVLCEDKIMEMEFYLSLPLLSKGWGTHGKYPWNRFHGGYYYSIYTQLIRHRGCPVGILPRIKGMPPKNALLIASNMYRNKVINDENMVEINFMASLYDNQVWVKHSPSKRDLIKKQEEIDFCKEQYEIFKMISHRLAQPLTYVQLRLLDFDIFKANAEKCVPEKWKVLVGLIINQHAQMCRNKFPTIWDRPENVSEPLSLIKSYINSRKKQMLRKELKNFIGYTMYYLYKDPGRPDKKEAPRTFNVILENLRQDWNSNSDKAN